MNTIQLGRFTLIVGLRVEARRDDTVSFDRTVGTLSVKRNNFYVSLLPSVALITRLDGESDVRLSYGRCISRPDPQSFQPSARTWRVGQLQLPNITGEKCESRESF
ncbi:MAG TPA: outer membrane beta-barrel protein [Bryobacteraceae bacterium]|nr:outer membrane beta-barrel protein [Bryobacteraceae bacterium]